MTAEVAFWAHVFAGRLPDMSFGQSLTARWWIKGGFLERGDFFEGDDGQPGTNRAKFNFLTEMIFNL